ncbi:MAG TPA: PHB depolymerase family esterase [Ktedonobacterales bacterium]|nr:PHB depolymerase family esterase [Ktedonobacterales bacterium]
MYPNVQSDPPSGRHRGVRRWLVWAAVAFICLSALILTSASLLRPLAGASTQPASRVVAHVQQVQGKRDTPHATSAHHQLVDTLVTTEVLTTGCGKRSLFTPGTTGVATLSSGGRLRSYRLHIPVGYQPTRSYPLVLNFHGHWSTAQGQERYTGFSTLADRDGFLVVYPQGAVGPDGATGWDSGGSNQPSTNDVLFVSDVLNQLQASLCVDATRIYATGFSNGGGMTSVLACRLAGRIAAFASVSGSYFPLTGGCHPSRAASILEFHGTSDTVVPYLGRPRHQEQGALAWTQAWASRDGCRAAPHDLTLSRWVTEMVWIGCHAGAQVEHFQVRGGIHAWPGGKSASSVPPGDRALNASVIIWQFFVQHPLSAGTKPVATPTNASLERRQISVH